MLKTEAVGTWQTLMHGKPCFIPMLNLRRFNSVCLSGCVIVVNLLKKNLKKIKMAKNAAFLDIVSIHMYLFGQRYHNITSTWYCIIVVELHRKMIC